MTKTKTEVSTPESTDVAIPNVFQQHVGVGTEEIKGSDIKFPMVKLLQKLSPQVDEDDARYLEGAKSGMFLNTDSKELYEDGFHFLPCSFVPTYIEWVNRDNGGGLVAVFNYEEGIEREQESIPETHEFNLYHNFFGFIVDLENKEYTPAIVSLTSTGFTASRELNYKIKMQEKVGLPIFSNIYKFISGSAENKKGKFHKWNVKLIGRIDTLWSEDWQSTIYKDALDLAENASSLSKRVDYSAARDDSNVVKPTENINQEDRVM